MAARNYPFFSDHAPLARPALAVVALFSFMHAWNDFLGR